MTAHINAGIALRIWAEDVDVMPKASTLAELRNDADVREDLAEGGVILYVPLIRAERRQRYNVMLTPGAVREIDRAAKTSGGRGRGIAGETGENRQMEAEEAGRVP